LDYLLGLAKASEWAKKFQITLDAINEIIIVFSSFPYGESEKSKVLMMIGDWEQSQEIATKILSSDSSNLFALKSVAFFKLARQGNLLEACDRMEELSSAVELSEGKNFQLWYHLS
jgi:tetratricopeptide repeat protein 21B